MQDRAGVFEEASGGTLFLDELDRLPLDLQKRLLRLLDDGRVTRLGEETLREVDIRLIAACGRSPENIVGTGEFRRDLYDKLAVVRVSLPALRDRLDDLPVLVERLLSEVGGEHISVTAGTNLSLLQKHPWQGNIRELRTVLERALLLAEGTVSDFDALPLRLSHVLRRKEEQLSSDRTNKVHLRLPYKEARERALRSFEKTYLEAALARNGANLSRTARDIGLTRHYLRKLLREHRLISARPPGRPPGRRNPPKDDTESS
jgi:DNA-binding NtrC family response regulator